MEADYRQDDGHVTLNYNQPKTVTHQNTRFDMIITVENSTTSLWSSMYHICLPPHQCDRKLVSKWIQWLIDINKKTVQLESRLSSEGTIHSYKCKIWSQTVSDAIDVCFGYSYEKPNSNDPTTTNIPDVSFVTTSNEDRTTKPDLTNISCLRLHEKPNEVYKYVLAKILQGCTPNYLLKSSEILSNPNTEYEDMNTNDRSTDIQTLIPSSAANANPISQSIKNLRQLSATAKIELAENPISSSILTDEIKTMENNSLVVESKKRK